MLARKALYVLKSSGAAFRAFLAENLDAMVYQTSYANPELWLRPVVKPDGFEYYIDDVLCISRNPRKLMKRI